MKCSLFYDQVVYRLTICTRFQVEQTHVPTRGSWKMYQIRNVERNEQHDIFRTTLLRKPSEPQTDPS